MRIMLAALGVAAGAFVRVAFDDAIVAFGGAAVVGTGLVGLLLIGRWLQQRILASPAEPPEQP